MKAAEEGAVEVMRLLLDKKVDIEASSKKGRTALSFAAGPSFNSQANQERDTPVLCLRLLLETGADPKSKDKRRKTPRDYAENPRREDALAIFAEFGC